MCASVLFFVMNALYKACDMERRKWKPKKERFVYLLPFGGLETTTPAAIQSATPSTQKTKPVITEKINGSCHHAFALSAAKVMLEHHDS